jgi:Flp pilus assembly protein TadD
VQLRSPLALLALLGLLAAPAGCASLEGERLYRSGTLALDRGDPAAAVLDLERAAALVPHASEIRNHLGIAYLEAGREREARAAFERALDLDCDNQAARHNLLLLEGGQSVASDGPSGRDGTR